MNIYVMRHGTTNWNEKNIIQGHSKNQLSKAGKALVNSVAIKNKTTKFDIIFASPLMRTMQTANLMNKFHNLKIIKDRRIIEINQGIFTGRAKSTLTQEELAQRARRDISCKMENYKEVYERTKDFVCDIIKNCKYENVLIITHNAIASFIEHVILKTKIDFSNCYHLFNFGNAEIRKFTI